MKALSESILSSTSTGANPIYERKLFHWIEEHFGKENDGYMYNKENHELIFSAIHSTKDSVFDFADFPFDAIQKLGIKVYGFLFSGTLKISGDKVYENFCNILSDNATIGYFNSKIDKNYPTVIIENLKNSEVNMECPLKIFTTIDAHLVVKNCPYIDLTKHVAVNGNLRIFNVKKVDYPYQFQNLKDIEVKIKK